MRYRALTLLVTALSLFAQMQAAPQKAFTAGDRLKAIRHAQVWTATDIPSMDLKAGPRGGKAFDVGETVTCTYTKHENGGGSTPKFYCVLPSGDEVKVRYGDHNGEVYSQVAATRLLWALGFGANRMYPVKVVCQGCPWEPFRNGRKESDQPTAIGFDPATIDVKIGGKTLETKTDEGWIWKELDLIDAAAGGASVAERDALKLLAVMIQHTDSKAANQRLLCMDKQLGKKDTSGACAHSFMMITDLGKTFGHANQFNRDAPGAVNFKEWSSAQVWKDPAKPGCTGDLPGSSTGSLDNPRVSEAGRKFLADLLVQLSDVQLHDLFDVARFTGRDPKATVDDWVRAFKQKRDQIVNRTCSL